MSALSTPPLIAVVNSSRDVVETIADILRNEGGYRAATFVSRVTVGVDDAIRFLRDVDPAICVYAVAFPYGRSWDRFQEIRQRLPELPFVLTTANVEALELFAGPTNAIELIGKPFDLQDLLDAVARALDRVAVPVASGDD
jgi:DNA-binding NtrC family response regulator